MGTKVAYQCFNGHVYTCIYNAQGAELDPEVDVIDFPLCPECGESVQLVTVPED